MSEAAADASGYLVKAIEIVEDEFDSAHVAYDHPEIVAAVVQAIAIASLEEAIYHLCGLVEKSKEPFHNQDGATKS